MIRNQHTKANRIEIKKGVPSPTEGNNGELRLGITSKGIFLYAKYGNRWYQLSDAAISAGGQFSAQGIAAQGGGTLATSIDRGDQSLKMGGNIVMNGNTVDGIQIAIRDAILTSTTTTANAALPKVGGAMTGAITTNSTFDGRDVATDGTKLDGIEASADVTDATNVTAAGALMDSEVTNLADVKAFDTSDYATAAQGTLATNALPKAGGTMTGDITMTTDEKVIFGDAGEYIVGDGSDLTIDSSRDVKFNASQDLRVIARDTELNLSRNLVIDVAGSEARLTDSSTAITGNFNPAHDQDIATKKYVDDNLLYQTHYNRTGITQAQCNALRTTPITIVEAQGSNKIALLDKCYIHVDRNATQTNTACDLFISYDGVPILNKTILYARRWLSNVTTDSLREVLPYFIPQLGDTLTYGDNQKIKITVDSDMTTDCCTGMVVHAYYRILQI